MALTDKPVFVDVDPNNIVNEMVAFYEAQTGKKLQPAQIERLIINGFAYRESVIRNAINDSAVQNLLSFASAPLLDYLAELVGVQRLPSQPATCTITLTFTGNTTDIVIPEGTRIAAQDNKVFFRTVEAVSVPALTANITVKAACDTEGVDGNDYAIGEINSIMDPQPYLTTATNSDITVGGSAEESDERLRARIKLAPSQFSNAGSVNGYKFFALSASPLIIDVSVPDPPETPGEVKIYPLMEDGSVTPIEILDAVDAACSPDNVRPLTDTVVPLAPTRLDYSLTVNLTLFDDAIQPDVTEKVEENIAVFIKEKRQKLGRDIIGAQLIAKICEGLADDIYNVALAGFADIIVNDHSFAFCTGVTVNVIGTNPG